MKFGVAGEGEAGALDRSGPAWRPASGGQFEHNYRLQKVKIDDF
jgi:hypothetical protein